MIRSKTNFFIVLFLLKCSLSFTQADKAEETLLPPFFEIKTQTNKLFILGFDYKGVALFGKDSLRTSREWSYVLRCEPYLAYFVYQDLGVGMLGAVEFFRSNVVPNNIPTVYEAGVFVRYYLPFRFARNAFLKRFNASVEFSYSRANYYLSSKHYIFGSPYNYPLLPNMSQSVLRIPVLLGFKIYKGLFTTWTIRYENFTGRYSRITPIVGLEYHFLKN